MYRCNRDHDHAEFTAEAVQPVTLALAPDGSITGRETGATERTGPVRCAECGARASWEDARQLEMFETAPALFGDL